LLGSFRAFTAKKQKHSTEKQKRWVFSKLGGGNRTSEKERRIEYHGREGYLVEDLELRNVNRREKPFPKQKTQIRSWLKEGRPRKWAETIRNTKKLVNKGGKKNHIYGNRTSTRANIRFSHCFHSLRIKIVGSPCPRCIGK